MDDVSLQMAEDLARASTDGELLWGIEIFATRENALAKIAETFDYSGKLELHSVFRDDPDMSVFTAITGNGPMSADNARFYSRARRIVLELAESLRAARAQLDKLKPIVRRVLEEAKIDELTQEVAEGGHWVNKPTGEFICYGCGAYFDRPDPPDEEHEDPCVRLEAIEALKEPTHA